MGVREEGMGQVNCRHARVPGAKRSVPQTNGAVSKRSSAICAAYTGGMRPLYAPRPRWNGFSLRTLFALVTVVGLAFAWLGVQVQWLRDRHAFAEAHDGDQIYLDDHGAFIHPAPGALRWFGEYGVLSIDGSRMSDAEVVQAKRLFPEAIIMPFCR